MATCAKTQAFYGCSNASGTTCTKVAVTGYVVDSATPVGSCNTLLIASAEFSESLATRISNAADAQTIASSLVLLLAIGFIYKAIRSALDVGDGPSDEKH